MMVKSETLRRVMRLIMAAFYLAVGVVHLGAPDAFLPIMPEWVSAPRAVALASGACEIAGALALLTTRLRRADAIMLALYAVCVFPAHIKHAFQRRTFPMPDCNSGCGSSASLFPCRFHAP